VRGHLCDPAHSSQYGGFPALRKKRMRFRYTTVQSNARVELPYVSHVFCSNGKMNAADMSHDFENISPVPQKMP